MRLQAVGSPVPRDAGRADPELLGHGARAPVRGCFGLALRGQLHQASHVHLDRWRAARQVALDALQTGPEIALTPARDLNASDLQRQRDVLVLQALRSQQHDAREQGQPNARELGANQPVEHLALFVLWRSRKLTQVRSLELTHRSPFRLQELRDGPEDRCKLSLTSSVSSTKNARGTLIGKVGISESVGKADEGLVGARQQRHDVTCDCALCAANISLRAARNSLVSPFRQRLFCFGGGVKFGEHRGWE